MTIPEITKRLQEDHLLGVVKIGGGFIFFLQPVACWIMNQKKYDPDFRPEDWLNLVFRNNIYEVNSENSSEFLEAMSDGKIDVSEIEEYLNSSDKQQMPLLFLIDFDNMNFVSAFYDIEVETYIPDDWTGKSDNPLKFLPENYSKIWM